MKAWQVTAIGGGAVLALLVGTLAIANPSQRDYEEFAVEQLSYHLRNTVCNQLPPEFEQFASECRSLGQTLIDIGRPQFQQLIFEQTERQDYILFSIYRTRLSFSTLTPIYQFHTLGILQQFYVYDVQQL